MQDEKSELVKILEMFAVAVLLAALAGALLGCSPRNRYVELTTHETDRIVSELERQTSRLSSLMTDISRNGEIVRETYLHDSTVIVLNDLGEVVSREVVRASSRSTEQKEMISIMQTRIDSILDERFDRLCALMTRSEDVPVPQERGLSNWERIKSDCFGYLCLLMLAMLLWMGRKHILQLARRFI